MKLLHRKDLEPEVESRWPETADEPAIKGEGERPHTVAWGGLLAFVLGAEYIAKGAGDPLGEGSGASGLGFITLGVVLLALTTLTIQGSKLARACLVVPLVFGAVLEVSDDGQPTWLRIAVLVVSMAVVGLLMLEPKARVFFGDDGTSLVTPPEDEL